MPARSNANGILYSEPTYSSEPESGIERSGDDYVQPPLPVATDDDGHDWSAWQKWFDAQIERHLDALAKDAGYTISTYCGELRDLIKVRAKKIDALELKIAEMRGAVDVLRGKGAPGSFNVRGTFDPAAVYNFHDVVCLGASSFIARRDSPGPCPGDDWQLLAGAGRRGARGERGPVGEAGPTPSGITVSTDGALVFRMSDGTRGTEVPLRAIFADVEIDRADYTLVIKTVTGANVVRLPLRPLFEQFVIEVATNAAR
jgi:hypothetical protein